LAANILSVLTRLPNYSAAIRQILEKIAEREAAERDTALEQFLIIAGLRRLEETIEQEVKKVPVLNDILENKVLGREYRRGIEEGVQQGELALLRRQILGRFGTLPEWADARLSDSSASEIEVFGLRLLDPRLTLEEVLE